jgi:hypothetical protein
MIVNIGNKAPATGRNISRIQGGLHIMLSRSPAAASMLRSACSAGRDYAPGGLVPNRVEIQLLSFFWSVSGHVIR